MNIVPQKEEQKTPAQSSDGGAYYATPLVDVNSTAEGYVLEAEMPGVSKEGLEITVEDGTLILVGHRQPLTVEGQAIHVERRNADFRRVYELDPSIDASKISARLENGILTVEPPKAESVKPRRIAVE
jgi:HSP20 family protein